MGKREVDERFLKALWNHCRTFMRKKGYVDYADDFAQYVAVRYLTGRYIDVFYLYVDFLRHTFGKSNSLKKKNRIYLTQRQIDNADSYNPEDSWLTKISFERLVKKLKPRTRQICIMYYQWGMYEIEIARTYGISEGRISQVLKDAKLEMKKIVDGLQKGTT